MKKVLLLLPLILIIMSCSKQVSETAVNTIESETTVETSAVDETTTESKVIETVVSSNIIETISDTTEIDNVSDNEMIINVKNTDLVVTLVDNSSTRALLEKLKEGDITINAHDFSNFEKVGELGFQLPTNDEPIDTVAGDVILYQGSRFVLYYDTNSWNFTRLGKVTNVDGSKLKEILGDGNVTMVLKKK